MTGGRTPGKVIGVHDKIDELIETTEENLRTLINTYSDENTPYTSLPNSEFVPRFNDYEHLSRVGEWGVTGADENDYEEAA